MVVVLDDSNILQADITAIAGLLILLTVAYYLAPKDTAEVVGKLMKLSRGSRA